MTSVLGKALGGLVLALVLASCGGSQTADAEWPLHGLDDMAQRFADLDQIDVGNVDRLGLAFFHDLGTDRGQEATPIMVDGVLYLVSAYDVVQAVDATNGEMQWEYDPQVRAASARGCCGPGVARGGSARWEGLPRARSNGRLNALDAQSGGACLGSADHRPVRSAGRELHDHRRAARGGRSGADRQWRR